MDDQTRLDDPMGPEFSVRIMGTMKTQGIETIGQLRQTLPHLEKWRGLGKKSVKEIQDFFKWLDAPPKLFDDPEYVRYRLEDAIGSAEALMHDVQRALTRVALKGKVSGDTRKDMAMKLTSAAEQVMRLPVLGEEK